MKTNIFFHTIYKVNAFGLPISASAMISIVSNFIAMRMVALLGKEQLAAGALAVPTFLTIMTITTTMFYAVGILLSHQKAKNKNPAEIGLIVKNGFFLSILLALPAAIGLWNIDKLLLFFRQDPTLVSYAQGYFHFAAINMFPSLMNAVFAQYYVGTGKPRFIFLKTLISLPLIILLSYVLILGHWGLPAMGLSGITCATLMVQLSLLLAVLIITYRQEKRGRTHHSIFVKGFIPNWSICRSIVVLGIPIGIQFGGELAAMTGATYLMGVFGTTALAASQIVSQYSMLIIVLTMGFAQALSILVSEAYGKNNVQLVKAYFQSAIVIHILCCVVISILFLKFPNRFIQFYMSNTIFDVHLANLATTFFTINVFFLFIDGIRHLLSSGLRGLHDTRGPMYIGIMALWFISLPISYFLGIICNNGPIGLRMGFVSGFLIAVIFLWLRFYKMLNLIK